MKDDKNNNYIKEITDVYKKNANPKYAVKMKEYMRNKFEFFGIKAQKRRKLTASFRRKANRPPYNNIEVIIKKFWALPEREYQYFASELLEKYERQFTVEIIDLFEFVIINKSWWDTVDRISKKLVGNYFKTFPHTRDKMIEKWINSGNIWLQRTTLLFQLGYKKETDVKLFFDLIDQLKDKNEFFIQKAIGWSLREYSKIEPEIIREFIDTHELSSLSKREGLKVIEKNDYKKE